MGLKIGDLVRPILCCSGEAGDTRCESAVGVATSEGTLEEFLNGTRDNVNILCSCGMSLVHPIHLELISETK